MHTHPPPTCISTRSPARAMPVVPVHAQIYAPAAGPPAPRRSGISFDGKVQLLAFCLFEAMVGIFWPSMMTMRRWVMQRMGMGKQRHSAGEKRRPAGEHVEVASSDSCVGQRRRWRTAEGSWNGRWRPACQASAPASFSGPALGRQCFLRARSWPTRPASLPKRPAPLRPARCAPPAVSRPQRVRARGAALHHHQLLPHPAQPLCLHRALQRERPPPPRPVLLPPLPLPSLPLLPWAFAERVKKCGANGEGGGVEPETLQASDNR